MKSRTAGILVVGTAILVWALWVARSNVGGTGPRRHVVVALPRADDVREGGSVTYLGVIIGNIERITIHDGRVFADLRVYRPDADLRMGDTITLRSLGLPGNKVLDFTPGPRSARLVGPGDTLAARP